MNKILKFLSLVLILIGTFSFQSCGIQSNQKNIKGIDFTEAVNDFDNALVKNDIDKVLIHIHDSMIWIHSNEYRQSKTDVMSDIESKKIEYLSIYPIDILSIEEKAEINKLERKVKVVGRYEGHPFEMNLLWKEEWKFINEHWQLIKKMSTKI